MWNYLNSGNCTKPSSFNNFISGHFQSVHPLTRQTTGEEAAFTWNDLKVKLNNDFEQVIITALSAPAADLCHAGLFTRNRN